MALIQVETYSHTLNRSIIYKALIPTDQFSGPGEEETIQKGPFKTLYLLHGVLGNCCSWLEGSRILSLSQKYNMAVIMPSGDNLFYVDQPQLGAMYGEFIGKELVEATRALFPLSHKREDTFIGGLSMGGFGAIRNGLKYSNTFGAILGLSSAFVVNGLKNATNEENQWFFERQDYAKATFGDLNYILDSDKNPDWLVKQMKEQNKDFPRIYLACGIQDDFVVPNREFHQLLEDNQISHTYVEGPGIHDWNFWSDYIGRAMEWLTTK